MFSIQYTIVSQSPAKWISEKVQPCLLIPGCSFMRDFRVDAATDVCNLSDFLMEDKRKMSDWLQYLV